MPNCFALVRKSDPSKGYVPLATVDEEICAHFGARVDPVKYYEQWYDCIGFALATGESWSDIREMYRDYAEIVEIVDFLEANFLASAWSER